MYKYLCAFFVSMFIIACSKKGEVQMQSVDGIWNKKQELQFKVEIKDPETPKDIIFIVRNNNEYPYSNLYIMSSIRAEKNASFKVDTLNYLLAKPNGEWLGKGFGETKEVQLQYKSNYSFPKKGTYIIGIKQAMRANPLVGIEDVGIRIENTTQP